jgi:hypothetical protein
MENRGEIVSRFLFLSLGTSENLDAWSFLDILLQQVNIRTFYTLLHCAKSEVSQHEPLAYISTDFLPLYSYRWELGRGRLQIFSDGSLTMSVQSLKHPLEWVPSSWWCRPMSWISDMSSIALKQKNRTCLLTFINCKNFIMFILLSKLS